MTKKRDIRPVHPGILLLEEFMKPSELSQYRVAKGAGVSPMRISQIIRGQRSITAETALRLARFFGMSATFWMNAQSHYDLLMAEEKLGKALNREVTPFSEAYA